MVPAAPWATTVCTAAAAAATADMRADVPGSIIWETGGRGSCVKAEAAAAAEEKEAVEAAAAAAGEEEDKEVVEAKGEDVSGSRERLWAILGRLAGRDSADAGIWAAATGMEGATCSRSGSGGTRALGWEKAIPESVRGIERQISLISCKRKGR